jgi:hypothetical protein
VWLEEWLAWESVRKSPAFIVELGEAAGGLLLSGLALPRTRAGSDANTTLDRCVMLTSRLLPFAKCAKDG